MNTLIVEILRSGIVESQHSIDAAVVDSTGKTVASFGNPSINIFSRSVIKPVQALPFVLSNAYLKAPDAQKAIALACASHSAQRLHIDFLLEWHEQLGIRDDDLFCGPQNPEDEEAWAALMRNGQAPTRIHNNCSGKHTGILATCIQNNWSTKGYQNWEHPIQKEIRRHLSQFSQLNFDDLKWGIDGCGIPTYSHSLEMTARLMSVFLDPSKVGGEVGTALSLIREACIAEPWMVAGHGYPCSEITAKTHGKVFAKVGAEGIYAALLYEEGLAIVLKARDGAFRACEAGLFALLESFANLDPMTLESIRPFCLPPIRNWSQDIVGSLQCRIKSFEPVP